ncbi:hypothetical protein EDB19DRAFT_197813 [Suillus lakei]|nr:hypothetical protein EDB19DRAFT_197813 [Suillus lakei]
MEGFVLVLFETEDIAGDLPVSIFILGGRNAPPEDGIYFINARVIFATATAGEETTLELCCVDDIDSGRALPTVVIIGKVSKGSSELVENRAFDRSIMHYGIMRQQLARIRCFYTVNIVRFMMCNWSDGTLQRPTRIGFFVPRPSRHHGSRRLAFSRI